MTERRLINNIQKENSKNKYNNKKRHGYIIAHRIDRQSTIYVPVYISASLKEIVNVNLQTKNLQANFLIYISVLLDIEQQTFSMLKSKQISQISQLKRFIQKNLRLQIGNKTVDIFHQQASILSLQEQSQRLIKKLIKKKPTLRQVSSILQHQNLLVSLQQLQQQDYHYQIDDFDDQDQIYDQQYFTKKIYSANSKITNHFISGIFACDFKLNSSLFPYHQIKSLLKITINHQYFKDIVIRYNLIFPEHSLDDCEQFNFIFPSSSYAKFGIYTVNFNYHKVTSQPSEDDKGVQGTAFIEQKTFMNLQFKLFCYNIPFILRNQVPVWILCFASLMLFYANADQISSIYGNAILLSVAFIFLLTNFRRSKYHANSFSLYEFTISCFIIGDFLFIIDSTNHFYSHDIVKGNIPTKMPLFHISTGITLLGVFLTIIILVIIGIFTFKHSRFTLPKKSGQILNDIWVDQIMADSENQNQEDQNNWPVQSNRQNL